MKTLTTDKLEKKFGEIDFQVIKSLKNSRCIALIKSEKKLVFAITYFFKLKSKSLLNLRNKIFLGLPVGKTLKKHSLNFEKRKIEKKVIKLPYNLKKTFFTTPNCCTSILFDIIIKEKKIEIPFCRIYEVYDPKVVKVKGINKLNKSLEKQNSISKIKQMDKLINLYGLNNCYTS